MEDARYMYYNFKHEIFPNGIRNSNGDGEGAIYVMFHLPQHTLLSGLNVKYTWPPQNRSEYSMEFAMTSIDILKSRYKGRQPCIMEWDQYDEITMNHHGNLHGCRAPYQNSSRGLPICSTKEKMKEVLTSIPLQNVKTKISPPCTSMESFQFTYNELLYSSKEDAGFWVSFVLPDQYKEITQIRAVNFQSVIGNAGGYIGLFLGKYYCA